MDSILEKARREIASHNLLPDGATVIVGISGGADSVALMAILCQLGYRCIGAHCNFHLRGKESLRDQRHAESICTRLGAQFNVVHFDVEDYIKSCSRPTSTEMACRDLRYEWFETLRQQNFAHAIAVAHNSNDNIETALQNLFRGTGISGLRGMLPANNRHIIRPLLHCSRADIERYLTLSQLSFINDSTNATTEFNRNKIRHLVIPSITQSFPDALNAMTLTIDNLRESEAFYRQSIEEKRKAYMVNGQDNVFDLKTLALNEPSAQLLLYEWFKPMGLTKLKARQILADTQTSGRHFPINCGELFIDRGKLHYSPTCSRDISFDSLFKITRHHISEFQPSRDREVAYFDAVILDQPESLSVRPWQQGDRLMPFGMKGSKLVSDIFNDAKVPLFAKARIPLLTFGNKILWVTGLRQSRLFSITSSTSSFIAIRYTGPDLF